MFGTKKKTEKRLHINLLQKQMFSLCFYEGWTFLKYVHKPVKKIQFSVTPRWPPCHLFTPPSSIMGVNTAGFGDGWIQLSFLWGAGSLRSTAALNRFNLFSQAGLAWEKCKAASFPASSTSPSPPSPLLIICSLAKSGFHFTHSAPRLHSSH